VGGVPPKLRKRTGGTVLPGGRTQRLGLLVQKKNKIWENIRVKEKNIKEDEPGGRRKRHRSGSGNLRVKRGDSGWAGRKGSKVAGRTLPGARFGP